MRNRKFLKPRCPEGEDDATNDVVTSGSQPADKTVHKPADKTVQCQARMNGPREGQGAADTVSEAGTTSLRRSRRVAEHRRVAARRAQALTAQLLEKRAEARLSSPSKTVSFK